MENRLLSEIDRLRNLKEFVVKSPQQGEFCSKFSGTYKLLKQEDTGFQQEKHPPLDEEGNPIHVTPCISCSAQVMAL
jgi:hypothetical protein